MMLSGARALSALRSRDLEHRRATKATDRPDARPPRSQSFVGVHTAAPVRGGRTLARSVEDGYQSTPIPDFLNRTPHDRDVRQYFYSMVADGVTAALAADDKLVRTQVKLTIPETNPEMDVYRIGTLLEMVRELVTSLCADGKPVKVCVQGSMGRGVFTALPLALSGVNRILENMDWGDAEEFVRFGAIGADEVDDSYAYIIVAPQNMVGASVIESLEEMSKKVEEDGKRIILVNPKLEDRASSGGVMGVRGRSDRLAFAATFDTIVAFRLLYTQGTFYPIVGALRYVYGEGRKWEIYDRVDLPKRQERYDLIATFDSEPTTSDITESFARVYG